MLNTVYIVFALYSTEYESKELRKSLHSVVISISQVSQVSPNVTKCPRVSQHHQHHQKD